MSEHLTPAQAEHVRAFIADLAEREYTNKAYRENGWSRMDALKQTLVYLHAFSRRWGWIPADTGQRDYFSTICYRDRTIPKCYLVGLHRYSGDAVICILRHPLDAAPEMAPCFDEYAEQHTRYLAGIKSVRGLFDMVARNISISNRHETMRNLIKLCNYEGHGEYFAALVFFYYGYIEGKRAERARRAA